MLHKKPIPGTPIDWAHPLAQGLVGCWLFDEGGGMQVYDCTQNRLDGKFQNMTPPNTWAEGLHGPALDFDGSDDRVDIAPRVRLVGSPHLTLIIVAMHISGRGDASDSRMFSKDNTFNAADMDLMLGRSAGTSLRSRIRIGGTTATDVTANMIEDDVWHQYACSFDGDDVHHWRDGVLQSSSGFAGDFGPERNFQTLIGAGHGVSSSVYYGNWGGMISHVLLYNRALREDDMEWIDNEPFVFMDQTWPYPTWLPIVSGSIVKVASETVNINEAVNRRLRSVRLASTTVNIPENANRRLRSVRLASTTVNIPETVQKTFIHIASTTVNIIETANRAAGFVQIATKETVNISETALKTFIHIASTTVNLVENANRRLRSVRVTSTTVNIPETVQKTFIHIASTTINLVENANRALGFVQIATKETINAIEAVNRRLRSVRVAKTTISLIEAASRRLRSIRVANETQNINDLASRVSAIVKVAKEAISIIGTAIRTFAAGSPIVPILLKGKFTTERTIKGIFSLVSTLRGRKDGS